MYESIVSENSQLIKVRDYWTRTHRAYLESVGTSFQAGRFRVDGRAVSASRSNQLLAEAAGIQPGDRVLDAGCGVCGPAIDIAQHIAGVRVAAVTISSEQASTARELIACAELKKRIVVALADYHQLPFESSIFDVVYFFESSGYSDDLPGLFQEAGRVLRPGGRLYIKDVFRKDGQLSELEREDLMKFDDLFATRTPSLQQVNQALTDAGFSGVRTADVTHRFSADHAFEARFQSLSGLRLSEFGKIHFRIYRCLPVLFGEVQAVFG